MANHIIDTYAWVAYFSGTLGEKAARWIIETGNNQTPTVVLAELKNKYVQEHLEHFDKDLAFIKRKSFIVPLDEMTAVKAGEIRATIEIEEIGIVDCVLLALSRLTGLKVLTGDEHFKGLPEARMINEDNHK